MADFDAKANPKKWDTEVPDLRSVDWNGNKDKPKLTEAAIRKTYPLYSGLLKYFPDALMEVAHLSKVGNDQHNPGEPLHWDRSKSQDQLDALMRHLKDAGTRDTDGERHTTKVAWRALAELQLEIERDRAYISTSNPLSKGVTNNG